MFFFCLFFLDGCLVPPRRAEQELPSRQPELLPRGLPARLRTRQQQHRRPVRSLHTREVPAGHQPAHLECNWSVQSGVPLLPTPQQRPWGTGAALAARRAWEGGVKNTGQHQTWKVQLLIHSQLQIYSSPGNGAHTGCAFPFGNARCRAAPGAAATSRTPTGSR